jgi:hypothetical protein
MSRRATKVSSFADTESTNPINLVPGICCNATLLCFTDCMANLIIIYSSTKAIQPSATIGNDWQHNTKIGLGSKRCFVSVIKCTMYLSALLRVIIIYMEVFQSPNSIHSVMGIRTVSVLLQNVCFFCRVLSSIGIHQRVKRGIR